MPVLKFDEPVCATRDAIVLDLADIAAQARAMRLAAQAEADRIIEAARERVSKQADQAHESASQEGYQAGYEQGQQAGLEAGRKEAFEAQQKQLTDLHEQWSQALQSLSGNREALEKAARQRVLEFALLVAERVVHRTIEVDQTVVLDQIASALDLVFKPLSVSIHIHPDDKQVVEEALPRLQAEFANLKGITLVTDEAVSRGGCLIKHGQGEIDADLDAQLHRIAQAILPRQKMPSPSQNPPETKKQSATSSSNAPDTDSPDQASEA